MTDPHYVFDGSIVRLRTGKDPAVQRVEGYERYILSADLGSAQDPSGIVIVEDRQLPVWDRGRQALGSRQRTCVHADRLKDFRYNEIIAHLRALMARPELVGRTTLIVDASGVGRGVSDQLHADQVPHIAVQMTGGNTITQAGRFYNASKTVLLSSLAAALEHGELRIAEGLALRNDLLAELESFVPRVTAAGVTVIDSAGRDHHSDMAIALALAWFASGVGGYVGSARLEGYY